MATALSPKGSPNCRSLSSRRVGREGIGRRLLVDLIGASHSQGYAALSLSVERRIRPRRLYESVGFVPVRSTDRPGQWSDTPIDHSNPLPVGGGRWGSPEVPG